MANELRCKLTTGLTLYAQLVRGSDGEVWNGSGYEVPLAAHWSTYKIAAAEQSTTGYYYAGMPAAQAAGSYDVFWFLQAGGSPATTDALVGIGALSWSGSADVDVGSIYASVFTGAVPGASAGLALTQAFPANFASLSITPAGRIGEVALVDTLTTYTGDTPQTGNVYGLLTGALAESYAANGAAFTLAQALYMIYSTVQNFSTAGTTLTEKKLDGTTAAMSVTLNDPSNPTSRVRTA